MVPELAIEPHDSAVCDGDVVLEVWQVDSPLAVRHLHVHTHVVFRPRAVRKPAPHVLWHLLLTRVVPQVEAWQLLWMRMGRQCMVD